MSNTILDYMREDDIKHDPWGTAMNAGFAVCEAMYLAEQTIPNEWAFRASPLLSSLIGDGAQYLIDEYGYLGEEVNGADEDDLLYAGRVIHRYINLCRKAGKDY